MMISCRRFTDLVASGELQEAGWLTRLQAGQHRWVCTRCRAFERNDRALDGILSAHRERLLSPERFDLPSEPSDPRDGGGDSNGDSGGPQGER